MLELAEAAYTGDFLEEDRYEDWAEPLRNEARAVYIDVLRALAESTGAARYFLRIIDRDPYDEPAHLGLVAALQAQRRARRGAARLPHLLLADARARGRARTFPPRL